MSWAKRSRVSKGKYAQRIDSMSRGTYILFSAAAVEAAPIAVGNTITLCGRSRDHRRRGIPGHRQRRRHRSSRSACNAPNTSTTPPRLSSAASRRSRPPTTAPMAATAPDMIRCLRRPPGCTRNFAAARSSAMTMRGQLRGQSADDLQNAFWWFEGEIVTNPNNAFVTAANFAVANGWSGIGDVRALNLLSPNMAAKPKDQLALADRRHRPFRSQPPLP